MMSNMIYTIGFTKKSAEKFFDLLKDNKIEVLIDIRLNNTSQLAGFAKYSDIKYFLKELCNSSYLHDEFLAPTPELLELYKKKVINWYEYESNFEQIMKERKIIDYISDQYKKFKGTALCLLCSEDTADQCHRRLVAAYFSKILNENIINL